MSFLANTILLLILLPGQRSTRLLKGQKTWDSFFSHAISFSRLDQVVAIICLHLGYNVKNCMRILYSY